jgi:hypothetical protein
MANIHQWSNIQGWGMFIYEEYLATEQYSGMRNIHLWSNIQAW